MRRLRAKEKKGALIVGRPDLDSFEPGAVYRHLDSGEILEFLGVASMPELDGEDVGVFRFVQGRRYLIATQRGHAGGERFTPFAEDQDVDEATTAEWRAFVEGEDP
jgi:hypothetical protein